MEVFLTYIFKSAGLLSIFYLSYAILLKKDANFKINRRFLLGGILASAILPAIYFTRKVVVVANSFSFSEIPINKNISAEKAVSNFGVSEILAGIYFLVTAFFLIRIAVQLFTIYKLIKRNKLHKNNSFTFIKTNAAISPFSFFKFIVYNPRAHSKKDLKMILQHEKIHAAQWHSLDILIANLTTALLWFNPLSWLYKKSVEQNLEYIADRETVAIWGEKKSYQQALVKVSVANLRPALTNHFYQSFIKKRILMLNKKSSRNPGLWKISLVFPLILMFMLTFNVKTEAQTKTTETTVSSVEYQDDVEISAIITKYSEQKSFDKLSKLFNKYDVALSFSEIEYSNNLLTKIKVSFLDKRTNETGVFSTASTEGIESFQVFTNKKKTGFRKVNALMEKGAISANGSLLSELGKNPMYIVAGKKYTAKQLEGKFLDITAQGINIFSAKEAIAKYGNDAKDGAIVAPEARIIHSLTSEFKRIDKENKKVHKQYLQIEKDKKPTSISVNMKVDNPKKSNVKGVGEIQNTEIPGNPIYILNGEKSKKEIVDLIDKSLIESVTVLKDESAVSLYGEGAKDGVVIITTKVLDKSRKVKTKKEKKRAIGIQKFFKEKTDYEIITDPRFGYTKVEGINAFQKYDGEPKSGNKLNFSAKAIVFVDDVQQDSPLVIINGKKETTRFMKKELQPENIENINVLKGKKAVEKYGKEAIDGVIEITTKQREIDEN